MAELEDAPWAVKKKEAISVHPVTDDLPDAPWHPAQQPSVLEDVGKGAVSGLAQGVIGIPGAGGDLQAVAGAIADKPMGWLAEKFDKNFPAMSKFLKEESAKAAKLPAAASAGGDIPGTPLPSSADIKAPIEKVTGPFYEAKTPAGKAVQTATAVAPAIALGGGGVPGLIAKSAGAGIASEAAGEGAHALFPKSTWAEPVARAVGAGGGLYLPNMARRAVTPLPMTDERLATVNALRGVNPELVDASSAGQLTESPRIMSLEGRSPRMTDLPQRQNEAYTQGVMRQAGAPAGAMFDTPGLAAAKNNGDVIDMLQNANRMSPTEFNLLNRGVGQERRDLFREAGQSQPFDAARDAIRNGPTGGNPRPLDMTGERYGYLKQHIQSLGEGAPSSHESNALFNIRQRMKDAFHNSMPADEAARLQQLDQQYSNFKTIEGIQTKADQNTVTPDQVFSKAKRGSPLEEHATQAKGVMTPLPQQEAEAVGPGTKLLGMGVGGLLGAGGGAALNGLPGILEGGPVSAIAGREAIGPTIDFLKNTAGRVVSNPTTQGYLKNQRWRPGPNSVMDRATLARLLMSPPVEQLPDRTK